MRDRMRSEENMLRKNLFVSLKRSCDHPAMLTYDDETKNLVCRFQEKPDHMSYRQYQCF